MMTDMKKRLITALILAVTCVLTSVVTVAVYSNNAEPEYEKTAKALVGEENLKDISTIKYKYSRSYLYTNGTTQDADSGNVTQEIDSWD